MITDINAHEFSCRNPRPIYKTSVSACIKYERFKDITKTWEWMLYRCDRIWFTWSFNRNGQGSNRYSRHDELTASRKKSIDKMKSTTLKEGTGITPGKSGTIDEVSGARRYSCRCGLWTNPWCEGLKVSPLLPCRGLIASVRSFHVRAAQWQHQ